MKRWSLFQYRLCAALYCYADVVVGGGGTEPGVKLVVVGGGGTLPGVATKFDVVGGGGTEPGVKLLVVGGGGTLPGVATKFDVVGGGGTEPGVKLLVVGGGGTLPGVRSWALEDEGCVVGAATAVNADRARAEPSTTQETFNHVEDILG